MYLHFQLLLFSEYVQYSILATGTSLTKSCKCQYCYVMRRVISSATSIILGGKILMKTNIPVNVLGMVDIRLFTFRTGIPSSSEIMWSISDSILCHMYSFGEFFEYPGSGLKKKDYTF